MVDGGRVDEGRRERVRRAIRMAAQYVEAKEEVERLERLKRQRRQRRQQRVWTQRGQELGERTQVVWFSDARVTPLDVRGSQTGETVELGLGYMTMKEVEGSDG